MRRRIPCLQEEKLEMSEEARTLILSLPMVCGMLAWAPISVLMSREPLSVSSLASIAFFTLVWWSFLFFFALIMRDTIRREGRWAINLKLSVCPQCGNPLRTMRLLIWLQRTWGCWTCHECGFELTKWGRPVKKQNSLARWAVLRTLGHAGNHEHRPQRRDERIQNGNDQTQRGDVS